MAEMKLNKDIGKRLLVNDEDCNDDEDWNGMVVMIDW